MNVNGTFFSIVDMCGAPGSVFALLLGMMLKRIEIEFCRLLRMQKGIDSCQLAIVRLIKPF